jgi:hypothetical protein
MTAPGTHPAPELAAAMAETRILREGITALAVELEDSAMRTDPSRKSEIEFGIAGKLRKLLGL